MDVPKPNWLQYHQARGQMQRIRTAEVPVEHAVSLPLPTRRWQAPGFAHFAAPAVRDPEGPARQAAPDRWWVSDARHGRLLIYALTAVVSFAPERSFASIEVVSSGQTLDELRQLHSQLDSAMDAILEPFFTGQSADPAARQRAAEVLEKIIPPPLRETYHALAPDFFAWLAQ